METSESLRLTNHLSLVMGEVDHTKVTPPYVRVVEIVRAESECISVLLDLRFTMPNKEFIPTGAMHSLEHLLAVSLKSRLPGFINFGPMGCQTGFYLTICGAPTYESVLEHLEASLWQIQTATEVPLCNKFQCGNFGNHDLSGAKLYAKRFLDQRNSWDSVLAPGNN